MKSAWEKDEKKRFLRIDTLNEIDNIPNASTSELRPLWLENAGAKTLNGGDKENFPPVFLCLMSFRCANAYLAIKLSTVKDELDL